MGRWQEEKGVLNGLKPLFELKGFKINRFFKIRKFKKKTRPLPADKEQKVLI